MKSSYELDLKFPCSWCNSLLFDQLNSLVFYRSRNQQLILGPLYTNILSYYGQTLVFKTLPPPNLLIVQLLGNLKYFFFFFFSENLHALIRSILTNDLVIYACPGGLVWVDKWNALQHPVAAAFLAVLYSDYMLTTRTASISCSGTSFSPTDLRDFAKSQVKFP